METPKSYLQNLKNGLITKKMLEDSLYSCNKRAKNYREKEREARSLRYDYYNNEFEFRQKKEQLYQWKDRLLTIEKPSCIHKEIFEKRYTKKIYDYEPDFDDYEGVIREGKFFDKFLKKYVSFRVVEVQEKIESYYLYYPFENVSFHTPIDGSHLENYPDLEVVEVGQIKTEGKEIKDLISLQFVKKLITLVETGKFKYIP